MKVGASHLTYCTNIHAGERWAEVRSSLERHVVAVKARVAPDRPFGVGLRLGAAAARALASGDELPELKDFLAREGLYVFTVNGFPYGPFHEAAVKASVYRPDWQEEERLRYSDALAAILAELLPEGAGLEGSVSTVPGCFRPRASAAGAPGEMADRILRHAVTLWRIAERTGKVISLALEPEPCCFLETVPEAVAFFEGHLFAGAARRRFSELAGVGPAASEAALRRHLGVCLDACHAAVEFEDPGGAVRALAAAGIRVGKIQLSTGLSIARPGQDERRALARFDDGVYLHQVVARRGAELTRFLDLPEALEQAAPADEWRVHFHVPIFRDRLGPFDNTQPFLAELLRLQASAPCSSHLEVETYTWDVLPEEHRGEPVVDAIAREIRWAEERLSGGGSAGAAGDVLSS